VTQGGPSGIVAPTYNTPMWITECTCQQRVAALEQSVLAIQTTIQARIPKTSTINPPTHLTHTHHSHTHAHTCHAHTQTRARTHSHPQPHILPGVVGRGGGEHCMIDTHSHLKALMAGNEDHSRILNSTFSTNGGLALFCQPWLADGHSDPKVSAGCASHMGKHRWESSGRMLSWDVVLMCRCGKCYPTTNLPKLCLWSSSSQTKQLWQVLPISMCMYINI